MNTSLRKLSVGWIGIAVLLIGILIYAQFNAAGNFDVEAEPAIVEAD